MTTDVRTLLHDSADAPSRPLDIDGAMRSERDRRRRRRGLGALVAVVVVALVTGAFVLGSAADHGTQVAIAPRRTGADVPDGWKAISADPGITMAIPPGWDTYDFARTDVAARRISVGTGPLPGDGSPVVCASAEDALAGTVVPDAPGTWIVVWEYADPASPEFPLPGGDIGGGFGPRPATFETLATQGATCDHVANDPASPFKGAFGEFGFVERGRVFGVKVTTVSPAGATPDLTIATRVLDTLRIDASESAPATTVVPQGSIPPTAPATTVPVSTFVPATTDERQIQDLFVAWLRNHPDDETRAIVEDGDALLDVIHEGLAQHSPADLEKYSGAVSAVRMLDADHAEVQYTLLFDGRSQFGVRTGVAVRSDGSWKVSRATECSLLSLGGLTCPAG